LRLVQYVDVNESSCCAASLFVVICVFVSRVASGIVVGRQVFAVAGVEGSFVVDNVRCCLSMTTSMTGAPLVSETH
jgi:hypothetical protein